MQVKKISYYIEKNLLKESTETRAETLYDEVGQIIKPYGNVKTGFTKKFNQHNIDDVMKRNGWNYIGKETEDNIDTYKWEKKYYQCHLYVQDNIITNYNIF